MDGRASGAVIGRKKVNLQPLVSGKGRCQEEAEEERCQQKTGNRHEFLPVLSFGLISFYQAFAATKAETVKNWLQLKTKSYCHQVTKDTKKTKNCF
ncbi:MAG: hypothetical protein C0615_05490 [Desulfuromonas sp.]|nr:MAG: hypothetical protein C0615_05490 [Desulfuromonas sp.]